MRIARTETTRRTALLLALALLLSLLASNRFVHDAATWSHLICRRLRFGGSWLPAAIVVLLATIAAWRSDDVARNDAARVSAFGLLLWVGAVMLAGARPGPTPEFLWGAIAPYLLALAVAVAAFMAPPDERSLRAAVLIIATLLALSVLADAETPWRAGELRRPGGLLDNRNYAGELLALAVPVVLASSRRRWRLLALVAVGAALALTRCRTAWLGALVGTLVVFVAARRRAPIALGVAALLLGALLAATLPNRLVWSDEHPLAATAQHLTDTSGGSGMMRVRQYEETLRAMRGHPAGLGPGRWQLELSSVAPELAINKNPHSDYLRALADGGIASLVGLCALFAAGAWAAARHARERPAGLGFIAALALMCASDCLLYRPETVLLSMLWLRAGIAGDDPP